MVFILGATVSTNVVGPGPPCRQVGREAWLKVFVFDLNGMSSQGFEDGYDVLVIDLHHGDAVLLAPEEDGKGLGKLVDAVVRIDAIGHAEDIPYRRKDGNVRIKANVFWKGRQLTKVTDNVMQHLGFP